MGGVGTYGKAALEDRAAMPRDGGADELTSYAQARAARDPEFANGLESGYADFKVGALLRQAREKAGLTQEEVAECLETKSRRSAELKIALVASDSRLLNVMRELSGGNSLWSSASPKKLRLSQTVRGSDSLEH
jgi:HTH-type transcriptional regulator / antitoxin HipB